jgi:hypothetical protein
MAHMHTIRKAPVTGPVINLNGGGRNPHTSGIKKAPTVAVDCSFADVRRACTRWLLKNDPSFLKQHQIAMEAVTRRHARKAGEAVEEGGTADTIKRFSFSRPLPEN